jgi:hypothetical protein
MPESYKPVMRKRSITGWRQVGRQPTTTGRRKYGVPSTPKLQGK